MPSSVSDAWTEGSEVGVRRDRWTPEWDGEDEGIVSCEADVKLDTVLAIGMDTFPSNAFGKKEETAEEVRVVVVVG